LLFVRFCPLKLFGRLGCAGSSPALSCIEREYHPVVWFRVASGRRQIESDAGRASIMALESTFGTAKPVVGMVHLPPLPAAPGSDGDIGAVLERARSDAAALAAGGVDGLLVENFGDAPFYPEDVPKHTVASMTRVARAVVEAVSLPVGINVLRNDAAAALSVAAAAGGEFVRVNVHTGARATDQGLLEGRAHETVRLRDRLGADVSVWADVEVKHSAPVGEPTPVRRQLADAAERGLADAVLVSGAATGEAVSGDTLERAVAAREELGCSVPILVGSGVTPENVSGLLPAADGLIVGTALKEDAQTSAPVSESRVERLCDRVESLR
jgi:membrane complex biogenesis BtpA family protein